MRRTGCPDANLCVARGEWRAMCAAQVLLVGETEIRAAQVGFSDPAETCAAQVAPMRGGGIYARHETVSEHCASHRLSRSEKRTCAWHGTSRGAYARHRSSQPAWPRHAPHKSAFPIRPRHVPHRLPRSEQRTCAPHKSSGANTREGRDAPRAPALSYVSCYSASAGRRSRPCPRPSRPRWPATLGGTRARGGRRRPAGSPSRWRCRCPRSSRRPGSQGRSGR